jgi:hypothetical protein
VFQDIIPIADKSKPSALVTVPSGQIIQLYYRDQNNKLRVRWSPTGYPQWDEAYYNIQLNSSPVAVRSGQDNIDLFYSVGTSLWHVSFNGLDIAAGPSEIRD